MPLRTYDETRPWARAILEAVVSREMPPWHAESPPGKFVNDPSLDEAAIQTFRAWANADAPEGNAADAPREREFAEGWMSGEPEQVFAMPLEYEVPAAGEIDYQYFAVPTRFTEDRYVSSLEVRPSNRAVVHHAIVFLDTPGGQPWWMEAEYLAGYAPGMRPQRWPAGQARLIPAGARLIFQVHYTATGQLETDRTRLGLVFSKEPPRERIVARRATNRRFVIPPGDPAYRVDSAAVIEAPMRLVGMRPHMHLRGKAFQFRYVEGETSALLLDVPRYEFDWQPYYYLSEPVAMASGSWVECTAVFDNSASNPANPDPAAHVIYGPQSWDEMMIGWFDVAVPLDAPEPDVH